jgi:hypothetical protein
MTEKPLTAKDIEEAFGRVDWEKALDDEIIKEHAEEYKRHYDHHLMTTLYGSSFADSVVDGVYYTESKDTSFFGKIKYGWRLFFLSVSDWKDAMVSEDYVEEFFWFLGRGVDL